MLSSIVGSIRTSNIFLSLIVDFSSVLGSATAFFSANPSVLLMQSLMIIAASFVVFLVLFATRDILVRSSSFLLQIFCILLVAVLPVIGFLLYLLIRPSRTIADKKLSKQIEALLERTPPLQKKPAMTDGAKKPKS